MASCSSSVIAAVIILVHVVSLYIAVYGNATLTVSVYVLNEAVKTELLFVDFVGKKIMLMLSDVSQKYISYILPLGARKVTHVSRSLINSKISVQVSETSDNNRCSFYIVVLWIITLCTLLGGHQLFRTHCLHLQGRSKYRGRMFVHDGGNPLSDHMLYPRRQQNDISLL